MEQIRGAIDSQANTWQDNSWQMQDVSTTKVFVSFVTDDLRGRSMLHLSTTVLLRVCSRINHSPYTDVCFPLLCQFLCLFALQVSGSRDGQRHHFVCVW